MSGGDFSARDSSFLLSLQHSNWLTARMSSGASALRETQAPSSFSASGHRLVFWTPKSPAPPEVVHSRQCGGGLKSLLRAGAQTGSYGPWCPTWYGVRWACGYRTGRETRCGDSAGLAVEFLLKIKGKQVIARAVCEQSSYWMFHCMYRTGCACFFFFSSTPFYSSQPGCCPHLNTK